LHYLDADGRWCHACGHPEGRIMDPSRSTHTYSPETIVLIETIAERVAKNQAAILLASLSSTQTDEKWLTVNEKAKQIGRSASFVRKHADELGGRRLGDGSRRRFYFPPGTDASPE
jgi:hypothetical protein